MPKVIDPYERQHIKNLAQYGKMIDKIFRAATQEAAQIGALVGASNFDPSRVFSFNDYPITLSMIQSLLSRLADSVETVVVNGIEAEWTLANNKNSALSQRVFGDNIGRLTQEQYRRYFSTNDDARQAFLGRKEQGLNLSERVWNYAQGFKNDIELGLDLGIRNGLDTDAMSRELRQFLRYPDKLFRRVRDLHGNLVLSQRAKDFHPGQGVYRSSYKNARRLAVTETNMAYRTADYERMQQLDFVVGIEIRLSNNHTCNGVPLTDICDDLCGRYPKDFKFTGWHPHCRCHVVQILKTEAELMEENRAILHGEKPATDSVNRVSDVPQAFNEWIENNTDRAKRSFSMPYFVADNPKYTPKKFANTYSSRLPYDTYAEYLSAMRYNKVHANFSRKIIANNRELSQELPIAQGKIMNFTEADGGKANPNFTLPNANDLGFYHNCQTCTMAYELRRRGFNVEAVANPIVKGFKKYREMDKFCTEKGVRWDLRFLTTEGKKAEYEWSVKSNIKDTVADKLAFIESKTAEKGRYEIYCAWKGKNAGAHVFIVERQKDGNLLWFDPQSGRRGSASDFENGYIKKMRQNLIGVLRIDDKLINTQFSSRFKRS